MTYLDVVNTIKNFFEDSPLIERVVNEDLDGFDLNKAKIYPLALFYVNSVNLAPPINTFTINILVMDLLDVNNETDEDNKDFIWNQSLAVINNFVSRLNRGDLFSEQVQITGEVLAEPFTDRFDNGLAGMGISVQINVPNSMTIC